MTEASNSLINAVAEVSLEKEKRLTLAQEIKLLSTKIKVYEMAATTNILDPSKWTIMRVDGHKFSTFTKSFVTRREQFFIDAMVKTTTEWLHEFHGTTAYVQSDEATLAIAPVNPDVKGATMMFGGRSVKLSTLSAGFFSMRFNTHLPEAHRHKAYFDCRVFQVDTAEDLRDVIRWRQLDAFRNGMCALLHVANKRNVEELFLSKKYINSLTTKEKLDVLNKYRVMGKYANDHVIHGTFIKKELVKYEDYSRSKLRQFIISDDLVIKTPSIEWLTSKYSNF